MRTTLAERSETEMLVARSDFVAIQKSGKRWVSKTVTLLVMPNALEHMRTGITVTKKTHKSAVRRNRIKRRLRAAIADVLSTRAKPGYDYVLIGRRETETCGYDQLLKDLKWCLKRTEQLKTKQQKEEK